jgi:hypothetical protein
VKHAVGELLTCPFCLAQWVGTGFVFSYVAAPRATRLAALTMTMVAGADVLQFGYDAIQNGALAPGREGVGEGDAAIQNGGLAPGREGVGEGDAAIQNGALSPDGQGEGRVSLNGGRRPGSDGVDGGD